MMLYKMKQGKIYEAFFVFLKENVLKMLTRRMLCVQSFGFFH